jgi:hypothetical protein
MKRSLKLLMLAGDPLAFEAVSITIDVYIYTANNVYNFSSFNFGFA